MTGARVLDTPHPTVDCVLCARDGGHACDCDPQPKAPAAAELTAEDVAAIRKDNERHLQDSRHGCRSCVLALSRLLDAHDALAARLAAERDAAHADPQYTCGCPVHEASAPTCPTHTFCGVAAHDTLAARLAEVTRERDLARTGRMELELCARVAVQRADAAEARVAALAKGVQDLVTRLEARREMFVADRVHETNARERHAYDNLISETDRHLGWARALLAPAPTSVGPLRHTCRYCPDQHVRSDNGLCCRSCPFMPAIPTEPE